MKEGKEPRDIPEEERPESSKDKILSENGRKSLQGSVFVSNAISQPWSAKDGTNYHSISQQSVEDSIDDIDNGIEVTNNLPVKVKDENGDDQYGIVDTLIEDNGNNTIIDYKTHDMSTWTISDAIRYGYEHGSQVNGYMHSPEVPRSSRGEIFAVGKSSSSDDVAQAYVKAVGEYGVGTVFVPGGEPDDVVRAAKASMKKTREMNK